MVAGPISVTPDQLVGIIGQKEIEIIELRKLLAARDEEIASLLKQIEKETGRMSPRPPEAV